jgi:uncharacterized membrane protein YphA (DoxX/SURF4 family)
MSTSNRVLGLFLLAAAIFLLILGITSPEVVDEFNVYHMATAAAVIPGALLLGGKRKAATYFARIVVGSVFIVSGLIKANDTVGFGIKLEEYFDENALGAFWSMFNGVSLPLAIFISGIEVLLGLAVLFGAAARLVSIVLLGMTLFFGWLTYFTAECNEAQMAAIAAGESFNRVCVTDCGCFGDALRGSVGRSLTPWESFYKDLGLFFLTLVIVIRSAKIKVNTLRDDVIIFPVSLVIILLFGGWLFGWMFPTYFFLLSVLIFYIVKSVVRTQPRLNIVLALSLALVTYGFAAYTYLHLPIKDYRPYAEGKNIKDQMKSASELGLEPTEYANVYRLENQETGEELTMNSNEYLEREIWKDKAWKIVYTSPEPIVIKRGYEPPIATFNVMNEEGVDIGEDLLNDQGFSFMVVMYDVEKADEDNLDELVQLSAQAEEKGLHFYALTSSSYEDYDAFRHEHGLAFPFYTGDEIFLKTIIRANPGLLLLKDGEIIEKWHGNDLPDYSDVAEEHM